MRIMSWNVNGIRAAAKKGFLDWLSDKPCDILALQETKAHEEQLDDSLINPFGYKTFFCSGLKKGYSGTALYTLETPNNIQLGFGLDEQFDQEGRILITEYPVFTFLNIYFPNGGMSEERLQFKLNFYEAFLAYLQNLEQKTKNIVVCGDFNTAHKEIDLKRPKENSNTSGFLPEERILLDRLISAGYSDTFRMFYPQEKDQYTWWSMRYKARERNAGWRLDYFFVNKTLKDQVKNAFILPDIMGSDHCPVGIELDL